MPTIINNNLRLNAPKLLDDRSSKYAGGMSVPYDSVAEANATILPSYRAIGLIVNIMDSGDNRQYWYQNGVSDADLVPISDTGALAEVAYTGDYNDLINTPDLSQYYTIDNPAGYISGIDSTDVTDALGYTPEDIANKAQPGGYASLDITGKIPVSQLPNAVMVYKGMWDASTNTPMLQNGVGEAGWVYRVSVAGTVNFGAGPISFDPGDYAIYSGTIWQKSDNTDAVNSVNGQIGDVVLDSDDILEGSTNKYVPNGTANQVVRGDAQLADVGPGLIMNGNSLELNTATTTLVPPTISTNWTLFRNDGITPYVPATSTAKTIIVDKGVKANISSTYQYPVPGVGQGLPTAVTGSFGTTLPPPATPSSPPFTNSGVQITSNTASTSSFTVTLSKPKSGLIVVGSNVFPASGNDTTTDTTSISFQARGIMTFDPDLDMTAGEIEAVYNGTVGTGNGPNVPKFQTSRARTFTGVTSGVGNYTYYLLDSVLGQPTSVILNNALDVIGAFQFRSSVVITNAAGINITIIVMRSNADNAFTAASLAFS